eukprot:3931916-Rhodomonas_salina.4
MYPIILGTFYALSGMGIGLLCIPYAHFLCTLPMRCPVLAQPMLHRDDTISNSKITLLILLHTPYAMSGTDLDPTVLHPPYAMSGTDPSYDATPS